MDSILNRKKGESDFRYKVRLCVAKKNKELDISWEELRDHLGEECTADHLRKKAIGYVEMVDDEEKNGSVNIEKLDEYHVAKSKYKESTEIVSDGSYKSDKLLKMSAEESKDPNFLLEAHGFSPSDWELVNCKNNIWNVYSKIDKVQTLYSSKITVKPKVYKFTEQDVLDYFEELAKKYQSPVHKPTNYSKSGKMLEVNIADLHMGKLCWNGNSGDEYNEKIAEERFMSVINDVLQRSSHHSFEKILFIWSNDFFHFDGFTKTTTGGTPQDTNLHFEKMYKLGTSLLIKTIDLLSQFCPVETMYIGSNHDKMTSYMATTYLEAWYRNNEKVKIDSTPLIRKYVEWGQCLIGFSHGHAEKKRLGKLMPIEQKEAWGRTKFHEFHCGHFHSNQAIVEENGTVVRYLPSVTGTDKWHYESGYVGAVKSAQSFIWDKERGLLEIIVTNI